MNRMTKALSGYAGGAGAVAAICAALCCAGLPIIVSVLAATGLGFLRNDAILLPVIGVAVAIALWGFWKGRLIHESAGPLMLGAVGGVALVRESCSCTESSPRRSSGVELSLRYCRPFGTYDSRDTVTPPFSLRALAERTRDVPDFAGGLVCLAGVAIIMYWPRS